MDKDIRIQGHKDTIVRENAIYQEGQEGRRILVAGYDTEIDYAKLADKYEYGIKLEGAIAP